MLEEALKYPVQGENRFKTIVVGGLLFLVPNVLIVLSIFFPPLLVLSLIIGIPVAIFVSGYYLRVLGSAAREEESAPEFENWGNLFANGLKFIAVVIAYFVPYIVVLITLFALGPNGGSLSGAIFLLAFVVLGLVPGYIHPVAQTNVALEDRLGAAFEFRTVFGAAFTVRYFVAVLLVVVVGGILSFIAQFLSVLLIGFFLLFYVYVFAYYLLGTGCGPKLIEESSSAEQSATDPIEY